MKRLLLILLSLVTCHLSLYGQIGTPTLLEENTSATDAASYATASVTPTAGSIQLLWVANSRSSSVTAVNSVTGAGRTWTSNFTFANAAGTKRITLFVATAGTPSAGVLTIDFSATNQDGCGWSLWEITGADPSGTIVQNATGDIASDTTGISTLGAFSNAANATFGAFFKGGTSQIAPGSGFTELSDRNYTPPNCDFETEYKLSNDTTVDATSGAAIDWTCVSVEVKALAIATPSIILTRGDDK